MSEYIVQDTSLTAVANKVREITGKSAPLEFPDDFIDEIDTLVKIPDTPNDSILFYSLDPFTVGIANRTKNWNGAIYYSFDRETWTEWDGSVDITASIVNKVYVIYLKGQNVSYFNTEAIGANGCFVITGGGIKCVGDLHNLVYSFSSSYACCYMFHNCYSLDFDLTLYTTFSETLGTGVFSFMFDNCYSLSKAPALTFQNNSAYCFRSMFKNCKNLRIPPVLPASANANMYCYDSMFSGCSSLETAPELRATNASAYCYNQMFQDCKSLKNPPVMLATDTADHCFTNMFRNCTSLKSAPALPSLGVATFAYNAMFYGCTSLETAPALPATSLGTYCYQNMFYGCTSLTTVPALPATTLQNYCYNAMFRNCTGLTALNALPSISPKTSCYASMYAGCSNIKISETQVDEYQTAYRIPPTGTASTLSGALNSMFSETGGTFTGTPTVNTTYYTSNTIVPAT